MEYEFQLRKEDPQHRMRNWIQLTTVANAKTDARDQEIQALKKRML